MFLAQQAAIRRLRCVHGLTHSGRSWARLDLEQSPIPTLDVLWPKKIIALLSILGQYALQPPTQLRGGGE